MTKSKVVKGKSSAKKGGFGAFLARLKGGKKK